MKISQSIENCGKSLRKTPSGRRRKRRKKMAKKSDTPPSKFNILISFKIIKDITQA